MSRRMLPSLPVVLVGAATSVAAADVERGRLVAHGGSRPDGAMACFRCHGLAGGGDAALAAPRLAGLPEYYLTKQMADFIRGTRPDAVMTPIAKALSDSDRRAVSAYYAGLPAPSAIDASPEPALGRRIAQHGDQGRDLPACATCHGPDGLSPAPAIPPLAGQPASYLALQLRRWQSGDRGNDPLGGMGRFARALRAEEVEAVAQWYAARDPGKGG